MNRKLESLSKNYIAKFVKFLTGISRTWKCGMMKVPIWSIWNGDCNPLLIYDSSVFKVGAIIGTLLLMQSIEEGLSFVRFIGHVFHKRGHFLSVSSILSFLDPFWSREQSYCCTLNFTCQRKRAYRAAAATWRWWKENERTHRHHVDKEFPPVSACVFNQ